MDSGFLGTGVSFPFRPTPEGRLKFTSGEEKIRQSVWIILSTAPGERLMRPEFGCGIHDLVFQPNTAALRGAVREAVRAALVRYEPRIDVVEVRVESPPDQHNHLLIHIDYKVRANNAFYNLVYPYFLIESAV